MALVVESLQKHNGWGENSSLGCVRHSAVEYVSLTIASLRHIMGFWSKPGPKACQAGVTIAIARPEWQFTEQYHNSPQDFYTNTPNNISTASLLSYYYYMIIDNEILKFNNLPKFWLIFTRKKTSGPTQLCDIYAPRYQGWGKIARRQRMDHSLLADVDIGRDFLFV